jgi:hypothetical protein
MFQEYITCRLLWINANPIIGNNGARLGWNFEFFCCKLENGGERGLLGD